ncbi:MAG: DUF433 domain-containing protein [Chloroflexi bacterium]|nr:DUF433 domain-containing protein [Chloroflexota bacterium]
MSALQVLKKPKTTEHPNIVRVKGVCGGRPIIKGTRISARDIAGLYKAGDTVEEILQAHPHLTPAAVHDAISYYHDHQPEIEQELGENRIEYILAKYNATLDERGRIIFPGKNKDSVAV